MPDTGVSTGSPEESEVQRLPPDFVVHRERRTREEHRGRRRRACAGVSSLTGG